MSEPGSNLVFLVSGVPDLNSPFKYTRNSVGQMSARDKDSKYKTVGKRHRGRYEDMGKRLIWIEGERAVACAIVAAAINEC